MKDLIAIANEAKENSKNEKEEIRVFAEKFLDELKEMKGTDISPYLSCSLDVIHCNYVVKLTIPTTANIFNSRVSNAE